MYILEACGLFYLESRGPKQTVAGLKLSLLLLTNLDSNFYFVFSFSNNNYCQISKIMSSRRSQSNEEQVQAQKIAETTSAREYFLTEEQHLLDQWADKSNRLFKTTGEVLKSQYEIKSSDLVDKFSHQYEELYNQSKKQFEAYCILNRKVQKKGDEIQNFAAFFNSKNHKKTFFNAWHAYAQKCKNIRKMEDRADRYKNNRTLKTIMKQWLSITMRSNRNKIKNDVLQKTEIEISKIQGDYEKLIKSLEEALEKKLIDLKKEEEEHKLLHDKYEAMYTRAKMEST